MRQNVKNGNRHEVTTKEIIIIIMFIKLSSVRERVNAIFFLSCFFSKEKKESNRGRPLQTEAVLLY